MVYATCLFPNDFECNENVHRASITPLPVIGNLSSEKKMPRYRKTLHKISLKGDQLFPEFDLMQSKIVPLAILTPNVSRFAP